MPGNTISSLVSFWWKRKFIYNCSKWRRHQSNQIPFDYFLTSCVHLFFHILRALTKTTTRDNLQLYHLSFSTLQLRKHQSLHGDPIASKHLGGVSNAELIAKQMFHLHIAVQRRCRWRATSTKIRAPLPLLSRPAPGNHPHVNTAKGSSWDLRKSLPPQLRNKLPNVNKETVVTLSELTLKYLKYFQLFHFLLNWPSWGQWF